MDQDRLYLSVIKSSKIVIKSYPSVLSYVLRALIVTVLLSTHNICFS